MWRTVFVISIIACSPAHRPPESIGSDASGPGSDARPADAAPADAAPACNVLTQTGCNPGEKCAWIQSPPTIGHIGCAPDGSVAIGDACSYNPPPMAWDNCSTGNACEAGICRQICDPHGGAPQCEAGYACTVYHDFFGFAGVCDPAMQ